MSATQSPQLGQETRADLLGIVWRHKWLILIALALGASAGYFAYTQIQPIYQSSARLLVSRKDQSSLPVRGPDGLATTKDHIETQTLLITSPLVIERAVKKYHLGRLPSYAGLGISDPSGIIQGGLKVKRVSPNADMLDLSFRNTSAEDTATVLTAVIDSYRDFLGELDQNVSNEALQLISQAKDDLLEQLKAKEQAYGTFRSTSPLVWNVQASGNLHNSRLVEIESERARLIVEESLMQGQLKAIEDVASRGERGQGLMLMVQRAIATNSGEKEQQFSQTAFHSELLPLLLEERILSEKYGSEHPDVKIIRKKVDVTRQFLDNQEAEMLKMRGHGDEPADNLKMFTDSLRYELEAVRAKQLNLTTLFEKEREAAKKLADFESADASYRGEIDRTTQLFHAVVKRLEEVSLVKDVGGFDTQLVSPVTMGFQVVPSFLYCLTLGAVVGLALGGAGAWYFDSLDRSFHTADQIRAEVGSPILGHIPVIKKKDRKKIVADSPLQAVLTAYHQPRSHAAEAYRAARTAILFGMRGDDAKVIQITSPGPGDGKSTTCANIGIAVAMAGKKVLLIDADLRRPQLHKLFGLDPETGFASVISDSTELTDGIHATPINNLFVLPCGARPKDPAELLSSPRVREILDGLREKFDLILVDTPPLLAVTDPSILATVVDRVVLTLRITRDGKQSVPMAVGILRQLEANVLGVIVNGVTPDDGTGYRCGATYGYGYGRVYGARRRPYAYEYGAYFKDLAHESPAESDPAQVG